MCLCVFSHGSAGNKNLWILCQLRAINSRQMDGLLVWTEWDEQWTMAQLILVSNACMLNMLAYFCQAGILFSTENEKGIALKKFIQRIWKNYHILWWSLKIHHPKHQIFHIMQQIHHSKRKRHQVCYLNYEIPSIIKRFSQPKH